jgi:hypothetical protein
LVVDDGRLPTADGRRPTADDPPATHLPRTNASSARLRIALVFAERGLPVLATVEDTEDGDDEHIGRLVHLEGDEGLLLVDARPHTRPDAVARSADEREHQDAVDVLEDHPHEALSDLDRRRPLLIQSSSSLSCWAPGV